MTRLGAGLPVAVNPDLIERIEETPDTVVTLVDGHKLVVEEPLDDVVAMIRNWRASIAAEAVRLTRLVGFEDDPAAEADSYSAVVAEQAGAQAPIGRLLRLPTREV